jgi:xanthine/uracil/vitamin C permease (AzgA family)
MPDADKRPDEDQLVAETEEEVSEEAASKARLFDVRRVIGGLFVVYGVIVTVTGLLDSQAEIQKAQGVRVNLWTGLAMLALGALFLLWQWWRPLEIGHPHDPENPAP